MITLKGLELVNYNNKTYYVYRKITSGRIKEGFINNVKEAWHCDIVLRNKNQDSEMLYFLNEISDAVLVEESPSPTPAPAVIPTV